MTERKKSITDIINKAGIEDVGFCAYSRVENHLIDCRAKSRLPVGSKTIIVCVFPFKVEEFSPENISRYAALPDYHRVCGRYLENASQALRDWAADYKFEWFIDNSPIPEVYTAAAAGLGVVGKNGLLITEKYGSYVFVGEIVTDLEIPVNPAAIKHCPDCGRCLEVCPKHKCGAECLSAISQKRGELSDGEAALLREYKIVWGCDICAEVCPLNKGAKLTYIKEFKEGYRKKYTPGEDISGRAYEWRGEKTVKRNSLIQSSEK